MRCGLLLVVAGLLALAGCAVAPSNTGTKIDSRVVTLAAAPEVRAELRDQLAELMKGHDDKGQLCFYVSTPLHKVDPAVLAFFDGMHKDQKRLREELKAWADKNHADLKFKFNKDLAGRARKAMEDDQGNQLQKDNSADFQHDVLMMMALDIANQKVLAAEVLKVAPDDQLRAYLKDSVQTHEAEIAAVRTLLQRYKYQ
jgi:hypothetical protein